MPAKSARPMTVTLAFVAWLLGAAVTVVAVVLTLTSPVWGDAVAAAARSAGDVSINVESFVSGLKTTILVVAIVLVAVFVFFGFMMYGGRNWARIVVTVLGACAIVSAVTSFNGRYTINSVSYSMTNVWPSWVAAAFAAATIVLMFLAQSNAYFSAMKASRQAVG